MVIVLVAIACAQIPYQALFNRLRFCSPPEIIDG
jgi:hypothetical protein